MKKRKLLFSIALVVVLADLAFSPSTVYADDDEPEPEGGIGIGDFGRLSVQASRVDVSPERNEAGMLAQTTYDSSTALKFAIDLSALLLPSINNNKHGFEGSVSMTLFPFDFDMWGGTAVTMLSLGSGGIGTIRIRGGFGVGVSYLHAYAYLKAQAATVIVPNKVSVEAGVFWIPNQVSAAWGDRKGDFDEQRRRASVFVKLGEDSKKLEFYAEHIDRQRGGHDKDYLADRENFITRDPDDDMRGIGIGVSLMTNF